MVADRLKAEAGGARAVAGNLAVEIVPQLAGVHLEWLGLLALIYAIRADWLIPDESGGSRANWKEREAAAGPLVERYAAWLMEQLRAYEQIGEFADGIATHLASTSAIIYERNIRRHLRNTIMPRVRRPNDTNTAFGVGLDNQLPRLAPLLWRGWLYGQWEKRLQHARPTPAGILIGCAVHDAKLGGDATARWEWSNLETNEGSLVEERVWDGDRLSRRFMARLERELSERFRRG